MTYALYHSRAERVHAVCAEVKVPLVIFEMRLTSKPIKKPHVSCKISSVKSVAVSYVRLVGNGAN